MASMLAIGACGSSAKPDAARVGGDPQVGVPPSGTVARLDGRPISVDEFVRFVEQERGDDYRLSSVTEATRLLRALLREQVLDGEVQAGRAGSTDAVVLELVERYGTRITVSDADVGARCAQVGLDPAAPGCEPERVRRQIQSEREALQRTAVVEELLKTKAVETDGELLAQLVTHPERGYAPALPPGVRRAEDRNGP